MRFRGLLLGLVVVALFGLTAVNANAAGVVTQTQINAAILPIDVNVAILPIDIRHTVQPLEVTRTRGATTKVTLSADVLFAFNQSTLTEPAHGTIAGIARKLRGQATGQISIDGYTDSIGSPSYNLGLSNRRAEAVQRALEGVLGSRWSFQAHGHGEADPVAPNTKDGHDNPAGRVQNRRVVITIRRT